MSSSLHPRVIKNFGYDLLVEVDVVGPIGSDFGFTCQGTDSSTGVVRDDQLSYPGSIPGMVNKVDPNREEESPPEHFSSETLTFSFPFLFPGFEPELFLLSTV